MICLLFSPPFCLFFLILFYPFLFHWLFSLLCFSFPFYILPYRKVITKSYESHEKETKHNISYTCDSCNNCKLKRNCKNCTCDNKVMARLAILVSVTKIVSIITLFVSLAMIVIFPIVKCCINCERRNNRKHNINSNWCTNSDCDNNCQNLKNYK